jgi:hypothetical protein
LTGTVTGLSAMLDAAEAINGKKRQLDEPAERAAADPLSQGPPLRVKVSWQRRRYRPGGAGATVVSGTSGPFWSPS